MNRSLIFLPGAGGSPAFWQPLGELLPPTWDKHYLGWPGLGDQPPRADVNGFEDLVRLVESRLPAQPVDLLAQSMGGVIALQVALRHPHRVRRLVLAATSGGINVAALGGCDWRADYRAEFPRAAAWITQPWPDMSAELTRVAQPTLLLWGDADPISPVAVGVALRERLPHADLHIVRGGDHGFAGERPREIAERVLQHLQPG